MSASVPLPDAPSLAWLRKHAKGHLTELRRTNPDARLSDAQFDLATQYGFSSWRALKAHIDSLTVDGQLFEAARHGDANTLAALLDKNPDRLQARAKPYEWSLLHAAAQQGHLMTVDLLLARGLDVNTRERGDNTCAMHWAAAAGHVDLVRRLAEAGGDVIGHGDDHELDVIGWATCWDNGDDRDHRAIADCLVERGARHHIFSAVALGLEDEVRRIVGRDPAALNRRMTRNDDLRMPLHFAVLKNKPDMVSLLIELGADPLALDGSGQPAAMYATSPHVDRAVMEKIRAMFASEVISATRGDRPARAGALDVISLLALADYDAAEHLLRENPNLIALAGALHVMAKRNDLQAVIWLLRRGADPNGRWAHWDAEVTPLHLAASRGHIEIVRRLLAAGADVRVCDSKHDGTPLDWARHFGQPGVVELLEAHGSDNEG